MNTKPNPNWFVPNDEFGTDSIPFPIILAEAERLFDEIIFEDEEVIFQNDVILVKVGVRVKGEGVVISRAVGIAADTITRFADGHYKRQSVVTTAGTVLSIAKKNGLQKLCKRLGREKDFDEGVVRPKKLLN